MITNYNTNPRREIYYLGALTIEILNNNNGKTQLFELFQKVNEKRRDYDESFFICFRLVISY